jgi:hypothetical protein
MKIPPGSSKKVAAALTIVSEDIRIDMAELTDGVGFPELGIDSLLILSLLAVSNRNWSWRWIQQL